MRFQRHVDEQQRHHVKELVETLERVVRDEDPQHLVLAGDEVALPLLRDALPKALAEKVVDVLRLDPATPEHRVLSETLEALRRHEAETDVERVQRLLDEYRAGGLAVVGLRDTRAALAAGQADHVLLAASPAALAAEHGEELAAELVTQARRTSADITFIEDAELLAPAGGVGALLRYRLTPDGPAVAAEEGP